MITTAEIMSLTDYERGKIDGMIELVSSLSENLNGKVTKLAENHIRHIQLEYVNSHKPQEDDNNDSEA